METPATNLNSKLKAKLIAKYKLDSKEINLEILPVAYRKATMNMALTTLACEKLLTAAAEILKEDIAFVVGTHFGEVDSTLDFLSTFYQTNVARPTLFQNSLHNSTLGFSAIQIGLTGPALTISLSTETQGSLGLLVDSLLGLSSAVLICFVDFIPEKLAEHYLENFPFLKHTLNSATAYLFACDDVFEKLNQPALPFQKFF